MDAHKEALFREWWSQLEFPDDPRANLVIPTALHHIIGGRRAVKQVKAVLKESRSLALQELQSLREAQEASLWWQSYIEGPADRELIETLKMAVPRRKAETDPDYLHRIRQVEARLRNRLPTYLRKSYVGEAPET